MEEFGKKRKLESENLFSKKYKGTSEMSTPNSFNEKDNEIYYKHHDHSYAENIIIDHAENIIIDHAENIIIDHANSIAIDFVNDDCLAEIFMYMPVWERPKIALVCQKWKRALDYSWSNVKKLQLTHWEYDEYPNCLKKYRTKDRILSFLKSLLKKCGRYLTQLDLTAYRHSNIVPVVDEYCPNLVKLRLRLTSDNDGVIFYDAFSRLSKLKVLTVIFQYHMEHNFKLYYLITALESLADTLTDLTLFHWKADVPYTYSRPNIPCRFPENTVRVLRQLKALKRFEFSGILIFPELRKYLRDNPTLECSYRDCSLNEKVIKPNQLMSITTLDLLRYKVSDDSLYTITNTLEQLTTLKIDCRWITNDGVVAISKMNNLTFLYFFGVNNSIDSSSIKLLKNLTRLMLPRSNKITDDLATKVLENSPKMKVLIVLYASVTVEFIKKAAEISKKQEQPLLLAISFITDKKQYESPYFKIMICLIKKK